MSQMSDYLENAIFNAVLRNTTFTSPTTVYVALFTAAPSDAGGGTEVSTTSTGYARQSVTFGAPTNGSGSNSADVTFPVATGDWGTVSHIGLFSASSAGNLLFHAPLSTSKLIQNGDQFVIKSGQLTVTLS